MISHQVSAGTRNQRKQPLNQHLRLHHDMCLNVSVRILRQLSPITLEEADWRRNDEFPAPRLRAPRLE